MRYTGLFDILCHMMAAAPASVLVIENHPLLHDALCNAILEEPDLTVAEEVAKDEGMAQIVIAMKSNLLLLAHKPDMILLTLGDSSSSDLELLSTLQKALPGTPILALTSNEVPGQEQAALEAGVCAVLTKAASRAELICKLRELRTKIIKNH